MRECILSFSINIYVFIYIYLIKRLHIVSVHFTLLLLQFRTWPQEVDIYIWHNSRNVQKKYIKDI